MGVGPVAAQLEALLFAAAEPLALPRLAAAVGLPEKQTRAGLLELAAHLDANGHGIALTEIAGGFQLLTRPEHAEVVAAMHAPRPAPLSKAALETLAIVAFRQPVTRAGVDELRGVHSEGALATLVDRGLVTEAGRADALGRPFLYVTTRQFLEHCGLRSLEELASLADLPPALTRAQPLPGWRTEARASAAAAVEEAPAPEA